MEAPIVLPALFFILISYFIGSIPTGVILSKYFGDVDIRNVGSGNIGATNVARVLGRKLGVLTLVGDALKGAVPTALSIYLLDSKYVIYWTALVGLSAFLGHVYSVFLEFKGGKGVATALGVLLVVAPVPTLMGLGVFLVVVAFTRYVSAGSILAAATTPVFVFWMKKPFPFIILSSIVAVIIIFRHTDNIKRLISGTEKRIGDREGGSNPN